MNNFKEQLSKETSCIDNIIEKYLPEAKGHAEYIKSAMDYSVEAGGKRIRPMIMLETYRLCNGTNEEELYPFMAALEMIHTYSLVHERGSRRPPERQKGVHDDLPAMDNDDYRRGKLTTHKKFGEDFGILAGDGLLNLAYETMLSAIHKAAKTGDAQAVLRYSAAADVIANKAGVDGMVGGQSLDVMLTDKPMNEEQLDYIFRLKTGALIEAAFMAGGIIAGCDENVTKLLEETGYNIGFAFQIKDDILDVTSTQEILGKPVLSDERNNKTTYVTLYGMEKAEKDTADMSVKALETLKTIGHNEYLEDLITMLIHRDR